MSETDAAIRPAEAADALAVTACVAAAYEMYVALDLYSHEAMTENIALYCALGYAETGRRVEHGYPRVYLRKPL